MDAGRDMLRSCLRTRGASVARLIPASASPANTPSSSACRRLPAPASGSETASTPALAVCSSTGTQTRTYPSLSLTTGSPVVKARPGSVPSTCSSGTPAVSGSSTWRAKSARYTTGSHSGAQVTASSWPRSADASADTIRSASV